jgi:hypothetical protein
MPLALVDLTGVAGTSMAFPLTAILTLGAIGRTIFLFLELKPSPIISNRASCSSLSAQKK